MTYYNELIETIEDLNNQVLNIYAVVDTLNYIYLINNNMKYKLIFNDKTKQFELIEEL